MPNADYKSSIVWVILLAFLVFFLELLNVMQCGYMGMILGHKKNNKKIGVSVLYSFVILLKFLRNAKLGALTSRIVV